MKRNETLYDRTIQQLKNKRIVVIILIFGAGVLAFSQLLGGLSAVWNLVRPAGLQFKEVQVTIQPYNFKMGATQAPILLGPIGGNVTSSEILADTLSQQIADTIRPSIRENYQVTLTISGSHILSSQPIVALVSSFNNMQVQDEPVRKAIDLVNGQDLPILFADPVFLDRRCNCLHFELDATTAGYESAYAEISQVQDKYSFESSDLVLAKTLNLAPVRSIVILEPFEGSGADSDKIASVSTSLYNALRNRLSQYNFLQLSPYTIDEIKQKAAELRDLPTSQGKADFAAQYRVDYIMTGNFVLEPTR